MLMIVSTAYDMRALVTCLATDAYLRLSPNAFGPRSAFQEMPRRKIVPHGYAAAASVGSAV